jgi:hypothetical protein
VRKKIQLKFFSFFKSKIAIYRRSLQPSKKKHSTLQKMKFINCFLFLWAIFALLDSYPDCESGSESGSESRNPIESRSGYGSGSTTQVQTT